MKRILLALLLNVVVLLPLSEAALPLFPTGDTPLALGDPLKRLTGSFSDLKSRCGSDQTGVFIEAYVLSEPDFIDAKEVWFMLDRHIITQVDYVFSQSQFSDFDSKASVTQRISQYFGSAGDIQTGKGGYDDFVRTLYWQDYDTGEKASIDYLKSGDVRVSFFNPRLNQSRSQSPPEPTPVPDQLPIGKPAIDPVVQPGEVGRMLQTNRPANGTIFTKTSNQGHGQLTIHNGTKWDAQVKLVSPTRKYIFLSVYIHSGKSATVTNIRANNYKLVYALGEGWDDSRMKMFRISATASFDKLLVFEKSSEYYSTIRVTLHPVEGGNVNSRPISQDDFLSY